MESEGHVGARDGDTADLVVEVAVDGERDLVPRDRDIEVGPHGAHLGGKASAVSSTPDGLPPPTPATRGSTPWG
jgi:hypothetical protein